MWGVSMPKYPDKQWSKQSVKAPDQRNDWRGVVIGHIDTGVTEHPALRHVLLKNGTNLVEPENPPNLPLDPLNSGILHFPGHGTRTSSVLTGKDDGLSTGVVYAGVASGVPLIPFRITDTVILSDILQKDVQHHIAEAIDMAVAAGCKVLSISLGVPWIEYGVGVAVDKAYEAGVIICCAGAQDVNKVCYPAKYRRTIAVGGYTGYLNKKEMYWSYSQDGVFDDNPNIDIWAPADPIWRANVTRTNAGAESYDYGWGDGTSFATPHVAAAAAYWLAKHGTDIYADEPWQRVEAFRQLLKRTASSLKDLPGFENIRPPRPEEAVPSKGYTAGAEILTGGLNIAALLESALPAPDTLTKAPLACKERI